MPNPTHKHYSGKPGTPIYAGMPTPKPVEVPELTLFAGVLELGNKVSDGTLIEAVAIPWFKILDLLRADPEAAFTIPPRVWEEIVAGAYMEAGFDEVILTPRSGDFGRDVIATKHGYGSIRIYDQVKAYKPGHLVTANDVRAMAGILQGNVSKGIVTTTSDFAPLVRSDLILLPLMPHRLELKAGKDLLSWLEQIRNKG